MISAFLMHARVNASMTRNKMYRTKVRQNERREAVAAQCTCKAGANGYCKHVGPYYMPYLTSLKVALGRFLQTLFAQKGLSSGINQPNEPQTFEFFSKIY